MDFQDQLLLIPITVGPIFMIVGFIMLKFPPKRINAFYGYRTSSSIKSQERWNFAQKLSAKEMIKGGGLLTLISFLGLIFNFNEETETVLGFMLMFLIVILLLTKTEKAIKKEFGHNK